MTKRVGEEDKPVTQIELEYGINAGLRLKAIGIDLVPIQEEQEARLERGISLDDWARMHYLEKGLLIAVRRNRTAMQNIHTEAEIRASERKAKQQGRR